MAASICSVKRSLSRATCLQAWVGCLSHWSLRFRRHHSTVHWDRRARSSLTRARARPLLPGDRRNLATDSESISWISFSLAQPWLLRRWIEANLQKFVSEYLSPVHGQHLPPRQHSP